MEVDLDEGTASIDLRHVEIRDFFTIAASLTGGKSIGADVSFHARWRGVTKRDHLRDKQNHFVGDFIEDTARIRWSAREQGFIFVSDPAHTSTNVFSEIGHERNGVFFS